MALDREALAYLPDEHKDRYREIEALVGADGWKWLMIWAQANVETQELRLMNASSWDEHQRAVGARYAFLALLGFEKETEDGYTSIVESIKEAVVLEDEEGNE